VIHYRYSLPSSLPHHARTHDARWLAWRPHYRIPPNTHTHTHTHSHTANTNLFDQQNAWRPVMARPRINAVAKSVKRGGHRNHSTYRGCRFGLRTSASQKDSLHAAQCHTRPRQRCRQILLGDWAWSVSIGCAGGFGRSYVRALTKARSQFCRLIMEIISGAALPTSLRRPTWWAAKRPKAASVVASASFFCTS